MTACVMAFFRMGKCIPLHGLDYARLAANIGPGACESSRVATGPGGGGGTNGANVFHSSYRL